MQIRNTGFFKRFPSVDRRRLFISFILNNTIINEYTIIKYELKLWKFPKIKFSDMHVAITTPIISK